MPATVAPAPPINAAHATTKSVAAVMVTYNPPDGLNQRVQAILEQVEALWIVDNASADAAAENALHIASAHPKVHLIRLTENLGLAKALNLGVDAAAASYQWILLLDHDSTPAGDMVAHLAAAAHAADRPVAALAPVIDYAGSNMVFGWFPRSRAKRWRLKLATPAMLDGRPTAILSAIGSGLLVNASVYAAIGGMREALFIDGVDTDFCLRACALGYEVLGVPGALLHHHLGAVEQRHLPGGKAVWPTHHSALRHYYIARNRIDLTRRYGKAFPGWFVFEFRVGALNIMNLLIFEQDRANKLAMIVRGTVDGFLRVQGKYKP